VPFFQMLLPSKALKIIYGNVKPKMLAKMTPGRSGS
jgi:hypothetical protein